MILKRTVTKLLILFATSSFAQEEPVVLNKELKPFAFQWDDSLQLLAGEFIVTDGFGGYTYTFDSSGKFERVDFGCLGRSGVLAKGKVKLTTGGHVQLMFKKIFRHSIFLHSTNIYC